MAGEEGERKGGARYSACLRCTQSCYRTHGKPNSDAGFSSFFKVMLNGFSDKLKIPPKFADQVRDWMGPDIILEGPSGQLWHAKLCPMGTGMTIEHGWKNFVSDHAIELGDFLVFKHSGKSHFIVQIFGRSGCEKQSAFTVRSIELETEKLNHDKQEDKNKNIQNPSFIVSAMSVDTKDKIKEDTKEILDTHITDFVLEHTAIPDDKMYTWSAAPKIYERLQNLPDTYLSSTKPESISAPSECRNISKTGKPVKGVERLTCVLSSDDKLKMQDFKSQMNKSRIYVSKHVNVSKHRKAINEAMSYKTRNLACLIIMSRSHLCSGSFKLSFPLDVRRSWFPDYEVGFTLLGPDKEKWPVTSPGKDVKHNFIKGWRNFAEHYNLKRGDICIFELVKRKLLTLKVHFFRKADRISARMKGGTGETKNETSRSKDCICTKIKSQKMQVKIKPEEEFFPSIPLISPGAGHHADIQKQGQRRVGLLKPGCQGTKESLGCSVHGRKKCCCLLKEMKDDDFTTAGHEYPENKYSSKVMKYDPSVENRTGQCRVGLLKPGCQETKESLGCSVHGRKKCCCLLKEMKDDDFTTAGHEYPENKYSSKVMKYDPSVEHRTGQCRVGLLKPGCQETKESLGCSVHGRRKCCCLLKEMKDDDFTTAGNEYPENKYSSKVMKYDPSVENRTGSVLSKRNKLLNDERDHMPTLMIDKKPYFLRRERHKRQTRPNAGVSCRSGVQIAAHKRDLRCSDVIELD